MGLSVVLGFGAKNVDLLWTSKTQHITHGSEDVHVVWHEL